MTKMSSHREVGNLLLVSPPNHPNCLHLLHAPQCKNPTVYTCCIKIGHCFHIFNSTISFHSLIAIAPRARLECNSPDCFKVTPQHPTNENLTTFRPKKVDVYRLLLLLMLMLMLLWLSLLFSPSFDIKKVTRDLLLQKFSTIFSHGFFP